MVKLKMVFKMLVTCNIISGQAEMSLKNKNANATFNCRFALKMQKSE